MKIILEKAKLLMTILTLVIMVFSSFIGIYRYLETLLSKLGNTEKQIKYYELRIFISESLVLALTFLLGTDIIESMLCPNFKTLIKIIAVFLFRLVITYFVDKDISNLSEEKNKNES